MVCKKSYLNIDDCIRAMMLVMKKNNKNVNIYNLGTDRFITVKYSIKIILKILRLDPKFHYAGGKRGGLETAKNFI